MQSNMADESQLPSGRLRRAAELASLSVRTGADLLLHRDAAEQAARAARRLAHLRGLAAKLGQLAGYVEGLLPAEQQEAYQLAMQSLMTSTNQSDPTEIKRVVEEDLGGKIEQLYDQWEAEPFASASLGQVHRARYKGLEVAVKVQHPGIAEALESDLANASILESMASTFLGPDFGTKAMFAELATGFREELDYRLEAERQTQFWKDNMSDQNVEIPEVMETRTSRRVLTTRMAGGVTLEEACAASVPERTGWCQTLWRFVFRGILVHGRFNADPHPGNYLFLPNSKIVFLDFGCTRSLSQNSVQAIRRMHGAALRGDEASFAASVSKMLRTRRGSMEELARGFVRACLDPIFQPSFRVTRTYAAALVERAKAFTSATRKLEEGEVSPQPPELVFLNRLHFGFYSVLARLDAEVDYREVERQLASEIKHLSINRQLDDLVS
jgi:predicted unusual protein kinase regulating ubiquinone biosynthesis (AarF/ABC1/UbiB family)